jgi:hypothetical protein
MYNVAYYAKFMIEIVIVTDRILMLAPSFGAQSGLNNVLKIKRPYLVFIAVWVYSLVIDLPYFYLLNAPSQNILVNYGNPGYQVFTYFSFGRTVWSNWGMSGYFVMLIIYIIKNVVTFFIETLLNVISLFLFQRHLAKKRILTRPILATTRPNVITIQQPKTTAVTSHAQPRSQVELNQVNGPSSGADSVGGRNMANLVLMMSVTGFLHNMILLAYTIFYLLNPKPSLLVKILQFGSSFGSSLRHAINFLQFYFFNTNFRKETRLVFSKLSIFNPSNQ